MAIHQLAGEWQNGNKTIYINWEEKKQKEDELPLTA